MSPKSMGYVSHINLEKSSSKMFGKGRPFFTEKYITEGDWVKLPSNPFKEADNSGVLGIAARGNTW